MKLENIYRILNRKIDMNNPILVKILAKIFGAIIACMVLFCIITSFWGDHDYYSRYHYYRHHPLKYENELIPITTQKSSFNFSLDTFTRILTENDSSSVVDSAYLHKKILKRQIRK